MSSLASLNAAKDRLIQSRATAVTNHEKKLADFDSKITAAEAEIDAFIAANKGAADIAAGLPGGAVVKFEYGRGDTKKVLTGTVLGTKPQDKGGVLYRLKHGEGFDEQIVTVLAGAVLERLDDPASAPAVDESVAQV